MLLGNGAIARGLLESGAEVITAYPGTPSTEILEEVFRQRREHDLNVTVQWSVNEKVAFDVALAASMCGKRAATAMKQVGLNVASDSLLSAAYTGVVGGFVVIAGRRGDIASFDHRGRRSRIDPHGSASGIDRLVEHHGIPIDIHIN